MNQSRPEYPDNPTTFGQALRKARIDAGLQIKELARTFHEHREMFALRASTRPDESGLAQG